MAPRFESSHMGRPAPQSNDLPFDGPDALSRACYLDELGQSASVAIPKSQDHGKVDFLHNICAECPYVSSTRADLEQHASNSGHTAFACICGAQFSRGYTLTRHINSMMGPSFPCGLCDDKSFPRRDKLGDHLRKWHRLGDKAYDQYKGGNSPCCPASLLSAGAPALEEAVQFYHGQQMCAVAPGFGPVPTFNGFMSVSNTAPDASSIDSGASPASSTAAENWWYSQVSNNEAYPLSI